MTTLLLPAWTDTLLLPAVYRRWLLSRAKHPSLGGHVRMSRRAARWVPHHSLVGDAFFNADGASPELVTQRRAGFDRLGAYFRSSSPITLEHTRRLRESLSDLQLTSRYRVPYPFSEVVREHLPVGAFMASSQGMHLRDMDGHMAHFEHVARTHRIPRVHHAVVAEADVDAGGHQLGHARHAAALGVGVVAALQRDVDERVGHGVHAGFRDEWQQL